MRSYNTILMLIYMIRGENKQGPVCPKISEKINSVFILISSTLPPAPNSLAIEPCFKSAEDAQDDDEENLHVFANAKGLKAKGWI
jgi:hypothetical protein